MPRMRLISRLIPFPVALGLALQSFFPATTHAEDANAPNEMILRDEKAPRAVVSYNTLTVDGIDIFYREAGPANAPVLLLLHGYPSSSHMYRDLIPLLANDYRVIAPDMVGFGATGTPSRAEYNYTFDALAQTTDAFTRNLGLDQFAMYVFDYGAPVGFRLAAKDPDRITAIISQNGNVYAEALPASTNSSGTMP